MPSPSGLTDEQAARALEAAGPNVPHPPHRVSWLREFAETFVEPLQLLLLAVAALSFVFGEPADGVAVLGAVLLAAAVETSTELRASRAIAALQELTGQHARVMRSGRPQVVPAADVVPGDLLLLEPGDVVAADARLVEAHGLRVDEAFLTGEAGGVAKGAGDPGESPEPASLLFAGSSVLDGHGTAAVTHTGATTELGRLGASVRSQIPPRTPLQVATADLARLTLALALAVSVAVPVLGVLIGGQPARDMVLTGLTLAFATVPEELPLLVTVLLAVAGLALARRGALLRRPAAGEALGSVTVLLTDKTGTLTQNRMQLAHVVGERAEVLRVAWAAQGGPGSTSRDPMDAAVAAAAVAAGSSLDGEVTEVLPFDAVRRRVARGWREAAGDTGLADEPGGDWLAVAGAPETVLPLATDGAPGDPAWAAEAQTLAVQGFRVIAVARRALTSRAARLEESGLTLVGLLAFDDPMREGVPEAVAVLARAGVATVLVTGDHAATASAVARHAGLPAERVLTGGATLAAIPDDELAATLRHGTVIARATPADKLRVTKALQRNEQVVAVTGDGVNDAPALAAADVGIAMGRRGTELARQTAGLVLTDDAYPTIAVAVERGRGIASQLRRAVAFYLGAKVALVVVLLAALLAHHPVPLAPVHLVLLEVFMDVGASLAFVGEPVAPQAMERGPRPRGARFVDRPFLLALATTAVTLGVAVAPAYLLLLGRGAGPGQARTGAVLAWLAAHTLIAWSLRARPGLPAQANPAFAAWTAAALVVAAVCCLTPAATVVRLQPMTLAQAGVPLVGAAVAVLLAAGARAAGGRWRTL